MTEYTEDTEDTPDISAENVARMTEGLTPGPWFSGIDDYQGTVDVYADYRVVNAQCIIHSHKIGVSEFGDDKRIANARFIAWAREAVPAMAEALKAAEAEVQAMIAAAVERAAKKRFRATVRHYGQEVGDLLWIEEFWAVRADDLRAIIPADAKAALERMLAEARRDEREKALREAVDANRKAREAVIHSGDARFVEVVNRGHDRSEAATRALIEEAK